MPEKDIGSLVSVDQAFELSRRQIADLHKTYLNTTLVSMLKLLNFDKRFVKAEGSVIWDEDGLDYIDFLAGYGSLNLGHNHPLVLEAVAKIDGAPNILQSALSPFAAALAKNLATITPGGLQHSFFSNSGSEAVESALKMARAATGKHKIINTAGAFHGKTMGSLSVSGREKYKKLFAPLVGGVESVPFGDAVALEAKLAFRDVAAFVVEPIQGEGGVIVPPDGYLKEVARVCKHYGALFILDEIQTGLGRTGVMFACERDGVAPDIMALSKSLSGGVVPIGATIATERVWKQAYSGFDKALLHTSTFGGNARACAAGIAAIHVIVDEQLPRQAAEKGAYLMTRLKQLQDRHQMIKDVRGRGLLVGMEFREPFRGFVDALSRGALNKLYHEYFASLVASQLLNRYRIITAFTLNNPNVLRFEPPLNVPQEHCDRLVTALDEICEKNRSPVRTAVRAGRTAASRLVVNRRKKRPSGLKK